MPHQGGGRLVLCQGASNTNFGWPEKLERLLGPGWKVINNGINSQTIADFRIVSSIPSFREHLGQDMLTACPEFIIFTAETNDANSMVIRQGHISITPAEVIRSMRAMANACDRFLTPAGTPPIWLVTLVNPASWITSGGEAFTTGSRGDRDKASLEASGFIADYNSRLRRAFPANRIVDFETGFDSLLLYLNTGSDQHLNDAGLALRAVRASGAIALWA